MRSNHLSYMGAFRSDSYQAVERETGLEPATPSLEGLCSSQLSYSRVEGCHVMVTTFHMERGGFEPP